MALWIRAIRTNRTNRSIGKRSQIRSNGEIRTPKRLTRLGRLTGLGGNGFVDSCHSYESYEPFDW